MGIEGVSELNLSDMNWCKNTIEQLQRENAAKDQRIAEAEKLIDGFIRAANKTLYSGNPYTGNLAEALAAAKQWKGEV